MVYGVDAQTLLSLLPEGAVWTKDLDSELGKLMAGIAVEFARIEQRADDVINESLPSSTNELIDEWETQYSLPDCCTADENQTDEKRIMDVCQSYRMRGSQSNAFFIEAAAVLGEQITITEYQQFTFGMQFGNQFANDDWAYTWQVNTRVVDYREFKCGDAFGVSHRSWINKRLECVFTNIKPAHMHVIFSYS